MNHYSKGYLKVPLALCTITFDVSLTEEAKPFYMMVSTWRLVVVPYLILIRPSKASVSTTKRKHRSVFFILTAGKSRAEKKYSEKVVYIKSRTKMKNKKWHKENVV